MFLVHTELRVTILPALLGKMYAVPFCYQVWFGFDGAREECNKTTFCYFPMEHLSHGNFVAISWPRGQAIERGPRAWGVPCARPPRE